MSDIFEEDDDLVESDVFAGSLDEDVDIDIPDEIYTMDARRRLENKLDDMRLEAELKDDFDDY
ncbi:hypothetical protein [Legionella micdadei]|uniref:Uncharacterized protein n=1 Tax=Legionella micdadei TaxID=451 RepID=A0A098GIH9_LEGMI|nr:hypothetical protein [Legionella micdadei]ARG96812.1 hypothetical protein B6N58_03535 [Legionella micdadei]ARG99544.1 hypothetical protein B6V88_03445 [Legionella micdadei]KTD26485.1 hypothetical protein Lmic_2579 [Legionella micdadei]NSL17924.1 hypothetical protein [Legionella micdadei]CEG61797.1 conserved protein of unknown function [Legionella micdadei]